MTTRGKGQSLQQVHAARIERMLRSQGGFTLGELLVTVIIVGLVTCLLATGATLATTQYTRSMALSESFMLYSSLEQVLDNELTYTQTIYGEKTGSTVAVSGFQSRHFIAADAPATSTNPAEAAEGEGSASNTPEGGGTGGAGSSGKMPTYYLKVIDSAGTAHGLTDANVYGQLALCSEDGTYVNRLLGKAAYNYGLAARVGSFTFDPTSRLFTINLIIANGTGDTAQQLVNETFTVRALNMVHLDGELISGGGEEPDEGTDEPSTPVDIFRPNAEGVYERWVGGAEQGYDSIDAAGAKEITPDNMPAQGIKKGSLIEFTVTGSNVPTEITIQLFLYPGNGQGNIQNKTQIVIKDGVARVRIPDQANNTTLKMKIMVDAPGITISAEVITPSQSRPKAGPMATGSQLKFAKDS